MFHRQKEPAAAASESMEVTTRQTKWTPTGMGLGCGGEEEFGLALAAVSTASKRSTDLLLYLWQSA